MSLIKCVCSCGCERGTETETCVYCSNGNHRWSERWVKIQTKKQLQAIHAKKNYKLKIVIKDGDKRTEQTFSKYTKIGDYLDANPQFKNKQIFLFNSKYGLPKNVKFDGVSTFIEGYGNV